MTKKQTWLAVLVLVPGLLIAFVVGLFLFAASTPPLHPNPQDVPSAKQSATSPEWVDAVEQGRQIIRASLVEQNLPGVSVAVGVGGDIVWAEGLGWADLEKRVPVALDTRFRIGTASIALTSAAVGLLVEKDQLKLDEKIQTYVPEFPEKPWPVTLRQLMGHVSGIRSDNGDEEPMGERCERTLDPLKRFADGSLRFEPGTQFRVTTYGWILLSAAVEKASGDLFFTFMRKQIFEPLGMDNTKADSATEPNTDGAVYYFPKFAADTRYGPQDPSEIDTSCFAGAGAFLSTPSDLVRFGLSVGKLLQPDTVQLLQTEQRLSSGEATGYGLGWNLETVTLAGEQTTLVGHDGELMGGMVGSLMTFPKQGIVVSVTSNIAFADTYDIGVKLAQAFADKAKRPARK